MMNSDDNLLEQRSRVDDDQFDELSQLKEMNEFEEIQKVSL